MAKYNIFTDGACPNNGTENARAGWAVIVCNEYFDQIHSFKGRVTGKQTNNRAELFAISQAFQWLKDNTTDGDTVTVFSDSEICIKMITGECNRVKNRDIWDELESICTDIATRVCIDIQHTPAHTDNDNIISQLNNEADRLAKNASRALI